MSNMSHVRREITRVESKEHSIFTVIAENDVFALEKRSVMRLDVTSRRARSSQLVLLQW